MKLVALLALSLAGTFLVPLDRAGLVKVIASNRGKVVVVNVWASWCAPCRKEMPALIDFEKRHEAESVVLVLLSANAPEEEQGARKFLQTMGVSSQSYIKRTTNDEQFINSVDPRWTGALPATFVYDRSGKRVKSYFGEVDIRQLESLINTQ